MTDIIDLIDQVTTCGSCRTPLAADGPCGDFCGEVCAERWRRRHGEPLGPDDPAGRADDLAGAYQLPCGRRLTVQHDTAGFAAMQMCRVAERFPTGDKFQWVMPLSQLTEMAADLVALETIWDLAIKSELGRAQRRTFPDGSWDVTEQRPPWRSDPLARVVGGSLNGQVIGVPPRPRPVLEMATAGGMEQYELLVSTSDGENYLYRYVHMPTGHVTYIEEQPG